LLPVVPPDALLPPHAAANVRQTSVPNTHCLPPSIPGF
jgi:hypothetical protein